MFSMMARHAARASLGRPAFVVSSQPQLLRTFVTRTMVIQADLPYHLVVGLPALSPTMDSGVLAEWYVSEGSKFSAGDVIAKIETDKATMDFEAQDDGYVAKFLMEAGSGTDIKVGTPILITVEEKEHVGAFADYKVENATAPVDSAPSPAATTEPAKAAPAPAAAPLSPPPPPPPSAPLPPPSSPSPPPPPPRPSAPSSPPPPPAAVASASSSAAAVSTAWGLGAKQSSPLAKTLSASQAAYIARYGTTGQMPL